MTNKSEDKKPVTLDLKDVVEHEDGSATYKFDVNEEGAVVVAELGLKLLLYCGLTGISTEEVFDMILAKHEESDDAGT